MTKLILKTTLYFFSIIVVLEILTRVFYLGKDNPSRFLDDKKVEKWVPNQTGFSVTGNRRQNFAAYRINNAGFNSYREFEPTKEKKELALVGDSFIEGFHQDYRNSIGKKIERLLPNIEVYEYGYAGYDFADQLHLINAYEKQFKLIDYIVIGLRFSDDLTREKYAVIYDRLNAESPLKKLLKKSKLIVYAKNIGLFDPPKKLIGSILNFGKTSPKTTDISEQEKEYRKNKREAKFLDNFKNLVSLYGYDKLKTYILLDATETPQKFLDYLSQNNFKFIDYSNQFKGSKKPSTLIYDQHWNDNGRTLIAKEIVKKLKTQIK